MVVNVAYCMWSVGQTDMNGQDDNGFRSRSVEVPIGLIQINSIKGK